MKLLCKLGWHKWLVLVEYPWMPGAADKQCSRCGAMSFTMANYSNYGE